MAEYNLTYPLRSGFDYQDLWTLKLCGEWILKPNSYKWLKIETDPLENKEFYLDDIVLLDSSDLLHLYQTKFKSDSQYKWTWDNFLEPQGKAKESLLKKWSKSFDDRRISKAALITNGDFSPEIATFLEDKRINIQKVKTENPGLYEQLKKEIGDDNFVETFFNKFEFIFEGRKLDDIEKEIIENLFFKLIRATSTGVNNLLLQIKREARKKHPLQLDLDRIKAWCDFDNPRPLNEAFEIPNDFQIFDKGAHQNVLNSLQSIEGGVKVIFGKPGSGKSVYLSRLSEELRDLGVIVIKHHYHIKPSDNSPFERLDSDRVVEAIKAQFKSLEYNKYLGELANQNSRSIPLREFITRVAKNLSEDNKNFVIIIDGLDHVIREKDVRELKKFLDEIFYPQKGLWIIFGMQPQIKNERVIQQIFHKCPRRDWVEIKGLSNFAVYELIKRNVTNLNLPDDGRILGELIRKLYAITQGNPLHLRYVLTQLKNCSNQIVITKYECSRIIPYGGSIEKYYKTLWNSLKLETKSFLLIFISVDFKFTRVQFIECISSFTQSPTSITKNFNEIEHLVISDSREREELRIYHNSFRVFLSQQKEWKQQRLFIQDKVKAWLERSKYENLKWAELRKLEFELGNDAPILEIDRQWLIEAIVHPRNPSQIESQLNLSSRAAFENNDFHKALKISYLETYYANAKDFVEQSAKLIWIESLKSNPDFIDSLVLDELPSEVLTAVADIAYNKGKFNIIEEIIEILQDRLGYQEYRNDQIPIDTKAIIKVIPYDGQHKTERVYKYLIQFRDLGISSILFSFYAEKLLYLGQELKFKELLQFDLDKNERRAILGCCIKEDLIHRTTKFVNIIENEKDNSLLGEIYLILQGKKLITLPKLPDYDDFPDTIPEYGSERAKWSINYYNFFLIAVIYGLSGEHQRIKEWNKAAPSQWSAQTTKIIFETALKIATTISTEKKVNYNDFFSEFKLIPDLKFPEDRDQLDLKFSFKNALRDILKDIVFIKYFIADSLIVNEACYKNITSTPFFLQDDLLEFVLDLEQAILEKDVYSIIIEEKFRLLGETINYFPDRAEEYAKLANLSNLYKEKDKPRDLLLRATDNFLGYGYHKDTYLFDVLEAIEFCTKTTIGSQRINNWTERIMPLIMNAGNYTDGDETNHLPSYLADFLSTNNKLLLFKFYFFQANKEELFPAQETFQYIIRALSLTQDIEQALAATAIDSDSFKELKEKATTSKEAQNAVSFIQDYFGEIYYKDRDYSSSSDYKEQIINYAEVKPRKLKKYLSQIKTKWDFEKYICGWAKYWLDHYKKKKLYTLIKSIAFKDEDIHSVSGEILDILYPLAYEFENRKTFAFLCSAQENDRGWARHWTDKRKAEKRWDFVRQKYPTRYLEFFKVSANYSVPLSRGVEFFCRFNDLEKAEMITEASVDFAEELMADLILEIPAWSTNTFQKVDELDLLFQRLIWPSPLARERAATEIAKLLVYSPEKKEIYRRLLEWIKSWRIESIIAIGLLPLLKAFQVCEHESDLSFIKISDIKESIQASSIVIEELLKELALRTKESIGDLPTYLDTENLPTSYNINKFFDKYIKTILAPIYFIRAEEIEEKTVSSFIDVWAYNAEVIAKEYNIELESNHYFYGRHENEKFLIGFSTKVSEVYRSAFLRVLHDFYVKGLLPGDFYLEYSFSTLPIDLSFWSFLPNRSPDWWPKLLNAKNNGAEKKISTIQFKEPIENIIRYQKDSKIILAAEGAIEPEGGWSEDPMHSFSLIGFGYNVLGANLPDAEEIGRKTLFAPQTVIIPTKADHLAYFFHNSFYFDIHSKPDQIKNLLVHPLITRNSDLTINLWQYFRDKNPSFNVNEALRSDLRIVLKNNKWILEDKNNKEFVIFEDWLEGLQERYEFEIPTPYGHYVLIDNQYLKSFLEKNNLRLGYLLQTIYRGRKYSYDKIQEMKESKLINISNLIIPV